MKTLADRKSVETKRRICVSVWAYAYERMDDSLVPDHVYDAECLQAAENLHIDTDRPDLDLWFRENFDASTGMWVNTHPELTKLHALYLCFSGQLQWGLERLIYARVHDKG
jgi:hypothetical protein